MGSANPRTYTAGEKQKAVERAVEVGPAQASTELGIPKGTLSFWTFDAKRRAKTESSAPTEGASTPAPTPATPSPSRRPRVAKVYSPSQIAQALERVAVNVMDFDTPDNAGYRARGEPCVPGGPVAYFATLPLAAILAALLAEGIPAYVSNTAGTYLCNQTLYGTLHLLVQRGHPARAGFIHLPLLPAMVAASGLEQPSMDAGLMVRAVEIALGVVTRAS